MEAEKDSDEEEYFDATDEVLPALLNDDHQLLSPSISISTMEGDPPEIEEDKDYHEADDFEGNCLCSCFCFQEATIHTK